MPTDAGAQLAANRRVGVAERGRGARRGLARLGSSAGARLLCTQRARFAAAADGADYTRVRGRSVAARICARVMLGACQNSWTGLARQWCEVRALETRAAETGDATGITRYKLDACGKGCSPNEMALVVSSGTVRPRAARRVRVAPLSVVACGPAVRTTSFHFVERP